MGHRFVYVVSPEEERENLTRGMVSPPACGYSRHIIGLNALRGRHFSEWRPRLIEPGRTPGM